MNQGAHDWQAKTNMECLLAVHSDMYNKFFLELDFNTPRYTENVIVEFDKVKVMRVIK